MQKVHFNAFYLDCLLISQPYEHILAVLIALITFSLISYLKQWENVTCFGVPYLNHYVLVKKKTPEN